MNYMRIILLYKSMSVLLQTSFGDITIDLETQKYPTASYNFLKLCKLKHYNNALFIKIQKDFVTQIRTLKPTTIWQQLGQNKPYFKDQIDLQTKINSLGLVGTSNSGSNMNNSQFFITLTKSNLSSLNGKHTIFGTVVEGLEVLKKINETYVDEKGRPHMNIRILHTFVLDDPFDDPSNLKSPASPKLQKDSQRLQIIEHIEMFEKYSNEKDFLYATKKQKAKKHAITLQMLGQLSDANIKPKQNILFVCKLNPITEQRDLQIIFSRFGPIKTVQIVRDWKTGQSLQYGFIEFQSQKSCEQAYLKMDGVLIDQRRIKVDFSQSVSKLIPKIKNTQTAQHRGGQGRQKMRQIIRNGKATKQYYGDKKYDIIGIKQNQTKYQNAPQSKNFQTIKKINDDQIKHQRNSNIDNKQKQKQRYSQQSQQRRKKKAKKLKNNKKQRYEVKQRQYQREQINKYKSRSRSRSKNKSRSRSKNKKNKKRYDRYD